MEQLDQLMTTAEVAGLFRVTPAAVRLWVRHGQLDARKFAAWYLFDRAVIEAWLKGSESR